MYAMGLGGGILAILATRLKSFSILMLAGALLLFLAGAIALMEYLPYERQDSRSTP
jgi:hypothetical protein